MIGASNADTGTAPSCAARQMLARTLGAHFWNTLIQNKWIMLALGDQLFIKRDVFVVDEMLHFGPEWSNPSPNDHGPHAALLCELYCSQTLVYYFLRW